MARITSKQAKEMNEAYAKVHQNLSEKYVSRLKQQQLAKQAAEAETNRQAAEIEKNNPGALRKSFSGALLNKNTSNNNNQPTNNNQTTQKPVTQNTQTTQKPVTQNNNQSSGNNQTVTRPFDKSQDIGGTSAIADKDKITPVSSTSRPGGGSITLPKGGFSKFAPKNNQQSSGGQPQGSGQQPTQEPGVKTSRTVVQDGNRTTTTTRRSADDSTPEGAAAVAKEKAAFQARREARTGGTPTSTGGGGTETGGKKPGLLGRLGSLAGRAVGSARNVASNVKQGAQAAASNVKQGAQAAANTARNAVSGIKQAATSAAGNIKKGAESVAGGAKRVAGGVADAATGNMTDFDKRGGKPQGVARVVAGGIDKLTGDKTDLDKRGPSKPAPQQTQQKSGLSFKDAMKAAQTKPGQDLVKSTQQPTAKPVLSNNSPAAKAGIPLNMRQAAADKNAAFQAARKSGNLKQYRKDNPQLSGAERAQQMAKERIAAKKAAPAQPVKRKVTSVMDMEGYDPMENLFDDTVQFLVSEGHAKDKSEAISIMSESEFIEAFNKGLTEVLNEQSEG